MVIINTDDTSNTMVDMVNYHRSSHHIVNMGVYELIKWLREKLGLASKKELEEVKEELQEQIDKLKKENQKQQEEIDELKKGLKENEEKDNQQDEEIEKLRKLIEELDRRIREKDTGVNPS